MPGEPHRKSAKSQLFEKFILQILSALPIQKKTMIPPIYWRRGVISANTIGFGEGEVVMQKIHNVLPFCQDIAYYLSCSKRKLK
jgi:hypothetical protein